MCVSVQILPVASFSISSIAPLFPVCYDLLIFSFSPPPPSPPFSVTDTTLSSERGKNQSRPLLIKSILLCQQQPIGCLHSFGRNHSLMLILFGWGGTNIAGTARKLFFLGSTPRVTTDVETRRNRVKSNYENSIRRPMWPIRILRLAYLPRTRFTSTHLLNLPPFDSRFSIRSQ